MDLDGSVVLVTGASRGVGAAAAVMLAQAGARVASAARATDEAPVPLPGDPRRDGRRVEDAGGEGRGADEPGRRRGDRADGRARSEHFGRLDALVNNAAITFPGGLGAPIGRYDLMMQVDLRPRCSPSGRRGPACRPAARC